MSSSSRWRGFAIALEGGSWTNTDPDAATSRVLNSIIGQKTDRSPIVIEQGPAIHKLDHIIVVWAPPTVAERLSSQIRLGELGDQTMVFVRLDPRIFTDVLAGDFRMADRRVLARTHYMRPLISAPAPSPESVATADPAVTPEPVAENVATQASDDKGLPGPAPAQAEIIDLKPEQSAAPPTTASEPATAAEAPPATDAQATETPSLALTGT